MKRSVLNLLLLLPFAIVAPLAIAQQADPGDSGGVQATAADVTDNPADQEEAAKIEANLASLSPQDRELAAAQRFCPIILDMPLGAMGPPVKVELNGESLFVCCKGCQKKALADPAKALAVVKRLRDNVLQASEIAASMGQLSAADRHAAEAQGFCAVMTDNPLGTMGPPLKIAVGAEEVFLCCKGCRTKALATPDKTLAAVKQLREKVQAAAELESSLAKLTPADRRLAKAQGFCAVMTESRLGSMGTPLKVMVDGQPVFLCCKGCQRRALANPQKTLATVEQLKADVAEALNK